MMEFHMRGCGFTANKALGGKRMNELYRELASVFPKDRISDDEAVLANYLMRPSGNLAAKWDSDPVISLEVVTPDAGIIKTGSASFETAGWRARYQTFPDLTGLFTCSYGTLGIVTKAAVKIFDRGEPYYVTCSILRNMLWLSNT